MSDQQLTAHRWAFLCTEMAELAEKHGFYLGVGLTPAPEEFSGLKAACITLIEGRHDMADTLVQVFTQSFERGLEDVKRLTDGQEGGGP